MKRFPYNCIPIKQILSPFNLDYKRVSLSDNLSISIASLFPIKSIFFLQKNPAIFSVSLLPDAPYGPDTDTLIDFLFNDFTKALSEVKAFFRLKEIEIISPDERFKDTGGRWSRKMSPRHEHGIALDIFEFHTVYTAAIKGQKAESMIMSLFIDMNTLFCLHVPVGIPMTRILQFLHIEHGICKKPRTTLFHPLLRRKIDPDTAYAGHMTSLIMFANSGYTVTPYGSFFKKIGIRKGECRERALLPCSNCLACSTYCPSNLYPSFLYHNSIRKREDETLRLNIKSCIQCGKCSFVCPSNLPLCETIWQTIEKLKEE
ncbi:MAG: 4Fe-4S dicluster domain-containing protein [bacterium]